MDFQSAMETFAEAWVAANAGKLPFHHPFSNSNNTSASSIQPEDQEPNNQQLIRRRDSKLPREGTTTTGTTPGMDLSTFPRHPTAPSHPITGGKAIPIHCLLKFISEDTSPPHSESTTPINPNEQNPPDVDDFLIVPAATPFNDLLTTALSLLGHPKETIRYAEGWISLRNWKPVRLDQVSDSPQKTVGDILHDLTNHATLNILITRAKCPPAPEDLKEKLLRLLLAQSSSIPLGQVTLSSSKEENSGGEELRRRFDIWYSAQHAHTLTSLLESLSAQHPTAIPQSQQNILSSSSSAHDNRHRNSMDSTLPTTISQLTSAPSSQIGGHQIFESSNQNHPVYQGLSPQKTRMRTSFDPEMELPRLQDWFSENPHPSRHQIQQYVRELNGLECRKDRKPLDINNVIYWFKNARAAQKRNELRFNGHSHSPHPPFCQAQPMIRPPPNSHEDPNNNNSARFNHNGQSVLPNENSSPSPNSSGDKAQEEILGLRIKEEEDSTSLDVEAHEGESGGPRDLSLEGRKSPSQQEKRERERERLSLAEDTSSSVSPRSSPTLSPHPRFEFSHHSHILTRFPPVIDHHSFMAYTHHLNNFPFPHPSHHQIDPPSAHKRHPFDFNPQNPRGDLLHAIQRSSQSEELISSLLRTQGELRSDLSPSAGGSSLDERRKRNRTFIDPVSEVPRLEAWFSLNTHPSHTLILKYTEELNRSPYRLKFPKLEPKNVQFWFKNRRAKSKRLKMSI